MQFTTLEMLNNSDENSSEFTAIQRGEDVFSCVTWIIAASTLEKKAATTAVDWKYCVFEASCAAFIRGMPVC